MQMVQGLGSLSKTEMMEMEPMPWVREVSEAQICQAETWNLRAGMMIRVAG